MPDRQLNILFISTDQQHFEALSVLGNPYVRTPQMDALAGRGVLFGQSYCTNPLCGPARASYFTGRMPSETGVLGNVEGYRDDLPTMGEWFRRHGDYDTIFSGKWHAGGPPQTYRVPGFDVLVGGINRCGILGDASVAASCDAYLRRRDRSRPFLLAAKLLQPHDICETIRFVGSPLGPGRYPSIEGDLPPLPANFDYGTIPAISKPAVQAAQWTQCEWRYYLYSYYRHVEMVDAEVGRIMRALEETDAAEDTIVVFTADHGEGLGHRRHVGKNTLFDECVRVPMICAWPGQIPGGVVDRQTLVSGLDILPTFCDVAGLPVPERCRGASLKGVLVGGAAPRRAAIFAEANDNAGRMVRTQTHKYIAYRDGSEHLFDMAGDPGEVRNLATDAARGELLRSHRSLLAEWESRLERAPNAEPFGSAPADGATP
jgi:arylsulfatase A-like enzyme